MAVKAPQPMVKRASEGYYDDYESPLPFPLRQLVVDLTVAAQYSTNTKLSNDLIDFTQRVKRGDFDGTTDEANAYREREGRDILAADAKQKASTEDADGGSVGSQD
jgi:hypothetical protein